MYNPFLKRFFVIRANNESILYGKLGIFKKWKVVKDTKGREIRSEHAGAIQLMKQTIESSQMDLIPADKFDKALYFCEVDNEQKFKRNNQDNEGIQIS